MRFAIKTDTFRMSEEEFFLFCRENESLLIEKEPSGTIIIMEPAGFDTSDFNSEINYQLRDWNKQTKSGRVTDSSGGFYLPDGSMRSPDAAWTSSERLKDITREQLARFPHVSPDFVIEIKSPSDRLIGLQNKMEAFMSNGVLLGWLIDPEKQIIYIYRANGEREVITEFEGILSGENVLEGFELKLAELKSSLL